LFFHTKNRCFLDAPIDNFIWNMFYKFLGKEMSRKKIFYVKTSWNFVFLSYVIVVLLLMSIPPAFSAMNTDIKTHGFPCTPSCQEEEWNRTFGGTNIDVGYAVRQTSDDGYILTGYTRSYGAAGHNIWLIKTDSSGQEEWNQTFGGSQDDEGQSVQQTNDGGYILAGWTKSMGAGMKDVWLIKTDALGNEEWNRLFGGGNDDGATSVQQTTDGGFILTGYTSSFGTGSVDVWLIKTDEMGNLEWNETFGGYSSDGAWSVQQTTDEGYILTGWTYSSGPGYVGNVWLVKTDEAGVLQWDQTFGGEDVDRGYWVQQTRDGGYIITGYTDSEGAGLDDVLLIKTDDSGNELWSQTFGGTGRDYGYCVRQTFEGGYIIAGYTLSYGAGSEDVWVIKTDASGNMVWDQTYGGLYSDEGFAVQQTTDSGFIVIGHTLSYGAGVHDVWLIKIKGEGVPPLIVDANGPYEGFVGESILFTGTVSGGIPPYVFDWDFGDETYSNEQSPSHVYMTAGVYPVTFTVVDNFGTNVSDHTTVTVLQSDMTPPEIEILKPLEKSLYLANRRILPFPVTFMIGAVDISVNASDNDSGIAMVSFYLNGKLMSSVPSPPYTWYWSERGFGRYNILVEAVDEAGNNATAQMNVWRMF
jgi:hypothetical protein